MNEQKPTFLSSIKSSPLSAEAKAFHAKLKAEAELMSDEDSYKLSCKHRVEAGLPPITFEEWDGK